MVKKQSSHQQGKKTNLLELFKPSIDVLASHNNLRAEFNVLDISFDDLLPVDALNLRNTIKVPLVDDHDNKHLTVDYTKRDWSWGKYLQNKTSMDMLAITGSIKISQQTNRKLELPPAFFPALPKFLENRHGVTLLIGSILMTPYFTEFDLSKFTYLDLMTNENRKIIDRYQSYINLQYRNLKYEITNISEQIMIKNY